MTAIACLCLAAIAFATLFVTVTGIDFIGLAPLIFYAFLGVTIVAIIYSTIRRQPDVIVLRQVRR